MLDVGHLLELAELEAMLQGLGKPRQAFLRRSGSTAYYALFHALLAMVAETFVTQSDWKSRVLFYRAIDHTKARSRCRLLGQATLPDPERKFFGIDRFGPELRDFANEFVRLQEYRYACDYDPEFVISRQEALDAIADARLAISKLHGADQTERRQFLSYVLFGTR
jgi:uncharacterized protein (UPF0332 family)